MKRIFSVIFAIVASISVYAAPVLESMALTDEVAVIVNTDEADSGPSPVLNSLGLRARIPFAAGFSFDPGISFWATYYDWSELLGRAVPIEYENRTAFVIGAPISLPVSYHVIFSDDYRLAFTAGFVLNARLGFIADKVPSDESWKVDSVNGYFWGSGRFFMPETSVSFDARISETFDAGLFVRALWPLANLWSGEGIPFVDGMTISGGIRVVWRMDRVSVIASKKAVPDSDPVLPAQ